MMLYFLRYGILNFHSEIKESKIYICVLHLYNSKWHKNWSTAYFGPYYGEAKAEILKRGKLNIHISGAIFWQADNRNRC